MPKQSPRRTSTPSVPIRRGQSECSEPLRMAVWSSGSVVTEHDERAVRDVRSLGETQRALTSVVIAGYLVSTFLPEDGPSNPQGLLEAAQRVEGLYGKASVRKSTDACAPFLAEDVDVFAIGVLTALGEYPDPLLGAEAAMMLRIGRNRAAGHVGRATGSLDHIGPSPPQLG